MFTIIEELDKEIKELQKEYYELEILIKESSDMEESISSFRYSHVLHDNVGLDESLLPSDSQGDASEGVSESLGFHKRTGYECQF